jgi:putative transposase
VCHAHGISEDSFYKWRKKYGGADVSAINRLRELELENARLKRIPAERDLEIDIVKELLGKNEQRAAATRGRSSDACSRSLPPPQLRALPHWSFQSALPAALHAQAAQPGVGAASANHCQALSALRLPTSSCAPRA